MNHINCNFVCAQVGDYFLIINIIINWELGLAQKIGGNWDFSLLFAGILELANN